VVAAVLVQASAAVQVAVLEQLAVVAIHIQAETELADKETLAVIAVFQVITQQAVVVVLEQ
jgi:hypothetical protein